MAFIKPQDMHIASKKQLDYIADQLSSLRWDTDKLIRKRTEKALKELNELRGLKKVEYVSKYAQSEREQQLKERVKALEDELDKARNITAAETDPLA